ncbi:hypothetical protein BKA57DRAFT_539466 [Linnemannia elongata]|nr:hypothetical protein BKA57DRAFT_539466 [Linnemannia elongata]
MSNSSGMHSEDSNTSKSWIHDAVFFVKKLLEPKNHNLGELKLSRICGRMHPFLLNFVEKQVHLKSLELTRFKFTASGWKGIIYSHKADGDKVTTFVRDNCRNLRRLTLKHPTAMDSGDDLRDARNGQGADSSHWITGLPSDSFNQSCIELREFSYRHHAQDTEFKEMFKKPWNLPNLRKLYIHGVSPRAKNGDIPQALRQKDGDSGMDAERTVVAALSRSKGSPSRARR